MQRFDILSKLGTVFEKLNLSEGAAGSGQAIRLELLSQVKTKKKDLDVLKERIGKEIANQSGFDDQIPGNGFEPQTASSILN